MDFSWPVAGVLIALMFRNQLQAWLDRVTTLKAGPVEIQREPQAGAEAGKSTLDSVSQMIVLLGESRKTELEVTLKTVGAVFPRQDQEAMQRQIAEIELLLQKIKNGSLERMKDVR